MKVLLLALLLLAAPVALAPTASAQPCEVPGCQVVAATLCLAAEAKSPKTLVGRADDCLTQPA